MRQVLHRDAVVCAVPEAFPLPLHAGKLLQAVLAPLGGKGGGSAMFAQGKLAAAEGLVVPRVRDAAQAAVQRIFKARA